MMYLVRSIGAFLLLTVCYVSSIVIAMAGIKSSLSVTVHDATIIAGNAVSIQATVVASHGEVDYDRYIDGKPLDGVTTLGLDLGWKEYTELFPEDNVGDAKRLVTLEATDDWGTSSDTATLSIVHETSVCGDAIIDTVDEECDDGNTLDGDGCSATCLCEGICMSLLVIDTNSYSS